MTSQRVLAEDERGRFAVLSGSGGKMPLLGLGTWVPPGVSMSDLASAVQHAILNCGYRHLDCASVYKNEDVIGGVLENVFASGVGREELWLTSKLWCTAMMPDEVRPACVDTLKNLRVSYLDLYLIHWPACLRKGHAWPPRPEDFLHVPGIEGTWREMEKLVEDGLVKNIGVSNFSSVKLENLWRVARIKPAVNQVELHPLLQQSKLREYCSFRGIHVSAYSPLGGNDHRARPPEIPNVITLPSVVRIGRKYNKTAAQIVLRWATQLGVSVVPKSTNHGRVLENSQLFDFELDQDDLASISAEDRHLRTNASKMHNPFTGATEEAFWDHE
ncbi:Aldose reductase [Pelomyxa schiedti]|nr:Aldose reductase [Pelomyxa schiedti]